VESILALEQNMKTLRVEVGRMQSMLLDGCDDAILVEMELQEVQQRVAEVEKRIRSKRRELGVEDELNLLRLKNNAFLRLQMNARALKSRLRERLRQRKFELEKLERSYRRTMNGKCLLFRCMAVLDELAQIKSCKVMRNLRLKDVNLPS
jgi:hypothetical protein